MSHSRVRALFNTALIAYATPKNIRVATDNVKFTPNTNETYIVAHLIPADTYTNTLGGDHKAFIGLYQMKVVTGTGVSTSVSDNITQDLQAVFLVDKLFTKDGFTVQVVSPIHSPEGKAQDGSWVVPCYFEYRADTN